MCITYQNFCCGLISLKTGSFIIGILKILIDIVLLSLFGLGAPYLKNIFTITIIFLLIVLALDILLLIAIFYKKKESLELWLFTKMIFLLVSQK